MTQPVPLVGIPADYRTLAGTGVHVVDQPYVQAVAEMAGAIPVILPALAEQQDRRALLATLDGILLTGSQSNVAPERYDGTASDPGVMHDPQRDATTLPLITEAVATGVPVLAICRGFQELNVAYGGSLHQKLHEQPGRFDHRAPAGKAIDVVFSPAHAVRLAEGGVLRGLLATDTAVVNSVHWQGIDRLGQGLAVEALAEDGTIEAVRVADAPNFVLAVQWHPEHRPSENPVSRAIFAAFGEAVRRRRAARDRA